MIELRCYDCGSKNVKEVNRKDRFGTFGRSIEVTYSCGDCGGDFTEIFEYSHTEDAQGDVIDTHAESFPKPRRVP